MKNLVKIENAVHKLKCLLVEDFPEREPSVEIRVTPEVFNGLIEGEFKRVDGLMHRYCGISPSDICVYRLAGVRLKPDFRSKDEIE